MNTLNIKKLTLGLVAVSAITLSAPTFAEGFYIGAGVSQAFVDESGFDEDDTGGKIFGGYNFNDYFGIEGSYYDFGDISDGNNSAAIDGVSLAIVGKVPVSTNFSIFGKVGGHEWDAETTGSSAQVSSNSGTDVFYGVGLEYSINQLVSLRGEVERYEVDDLDVDVATLGISFNF